MTMTKRDIALKIAEETGIKQIHVKEVIQKSLDHIIESLAGGQTVELRNFGIFKVKVRKGRMGRNPRSGAQVPITDKKVVTFKSGLIMKDKVK